MKHVDLRTAKHALNCLRDQHGSHRIGDSGQRLNLRKLSLQYASQLNPHESKPSSTGVAGPTTCARATKSIQQKYFGSNLFPPNLSLFFWGGPLVIGGRDYYVTMFYFHTTKIATRNPGDRGSTFMEPHLEGLPGLPGLPGLLGLPGLPWLVTRSLSQST